MACFRSLFPSDAGTAQPSVPPGYRGYAIGDVHGRPDLLDDALARIEPDNEGRGRARIISVFLVDLSDRGPSSAQVFERARTYYRPGLRTVFISGNHE